MTGVSRLVVVALVVFSGAVIYFSRDIDAGRMESAASETPVPDQAVRNASPASDTPEIAATPEIAVPQASGVEAASDPPLSSVPARLESDPAERRAVIRSIMEATNPDIGEALGLTASETEGLLDLLVTHQENLTSLVSTGDTLRDLREHPEDLATEMAAQMQAREAELLAFLGNRYARWRDYDSTLRVAWQLRRDVRASLEQAGMPMTDAQATALIRALEDEARAFAAASQGTTSGRVLQISAGMGMPLQITAERRQRLLDAAAPHLAPLQLETWSKVINRPAGVGGISRVTGNP